jgi:hypothetical protein
VAQQQAAAAAALAERLRRAAVVLRRQAGGLHYHPMTGRHPASSPELEAALAGIEQAVVEVRRAHAAVDHAAQVVAAALTALRAILKAPDAATLDAPYGRSAPVRHHPGALCTIVAERVEELARALDYAAILAANYRAANP